MDSIKTSTVTTLMKNRPEDLALFTAMALEQPVQAFNYSSGDELANTTSFGGAAAVDGGYAAPAGADFADEPPRAVAAQAEAGRADREAAGRAGGGAVAVQQRHVEKVGRNDPCPCGSGKKYKRCHGA
jgi:preprotein translocase subunit SecA